MKFTKFFASAIALLSLVSAGILADPCHKSKKSDNGCNSNSTAKCLNKPSSACVDLRTCCRNVEPNCANGKCRTVRVGIFDNRQPTGDYETTSGTLFGFDVNLAYQVFTRAGYDIQFYSIPDVGAVTIPQLLCNQLDCVASSSSNITDGRLACVNFLETDSSVSGPGTLTWKTRLLDPAGPNPTLLGALGVFGFGSNNTGANPNQADKDAFAIFAYNKAGFPNGGPLIIAVNSAGTRQDQNLKAIALSVPGVTETDYNNWTLHSGFFGDANCIFDNVLTIVVPRPTTTDAHFIYPGPAGDDCFTAAITNQSNYANPLGTEASQLSYTNNMSLAPGPNLGRGWSFHPKCCQLIIDAQAALNSIIADGTYKELVDAATADPRNKPFFLQQRCWGTTSPVAPTQSSSINSGFICQECVSCAQPTNLKCIPFNPCDNPVNAVTPSGFVTLFPESACFTAECAF